PDQGRGSGGVGQTPGQVAGGAELPATVAELPPLDRCPIDAAVTPPPRTGPFRLPARCWLSRCRRHRRPLPPAAVGPPANGPVHDSPLTPHYSTGHRSDSYCPAGHGANSRSPKPAGRTLPDTVLAGLVLGRLAVVWAVPECAVD